MTSLIDQHRLETTWSVRKTDDIVREAIKNDIPMKMEIDIKLAISSINRGSIDDGVIFDKLFSLVLTAQVNKPIQAIATQIGHSAGLFDSAEAFEWGMILVKECKNVGLYALRFIEKEWYVCPCFTLDKATRKKIDQLQYLPPMQIKPKPWTDNHNGGWLWENKHVVLGSKFNKHNSPVAYDVLNKLQYIPWEIDADTYLFEKRTNRNMQAKQFLRVINEYLGKPFHFVWRYDSRGRSYSSGYDLNLQSDEYGKALISLHNKEKITSIPNLFIAIAGHAGKDKLTWDERIKWVSEQDIDNIEWEQPMLGRKALRALRDSTEDKPSGYVMSLDATASGLQIMAAISGCKETAKWVNMIDPDTRHDTYTEVADLMNSKLSKPVPRKIVKQCVMTHMFNSKATPKALLSEEELKVFYETINGLLPGAEDAMDTINACWRDDVDHYQWVMPDNWMDTPLKTCYADQVHKLEQEKACIIKKLQQNTNVPGKES